MPLFQAAVATIGVYFFARFVRRIVLVFRRSRAWRVEAGEQPCADCLGLGRCPFCDTCGNNPCRTCRGTGRAA